MDTNYYKSINGSVASKSKTSALQQAFFPFDDANPIVARLALESARCVWVAWRGLRLEAWNQRAARRAHHRRTAQKSAILDIAGE